MKNKKLFGLLALFLVLGAYFALAQSTTPEAPSQFNVTGVSRRDTSAPGTNLSVIAGNITTLSIHGLTTTQTWAGVFGNITGTLALSNGANQVMYDWSVANPRGEIFATTAVPGVETIHWNLLQCYNLTNTDTDHYYTLSRFHTALGVNGTSDMDSINRTFDSTTHRPFYVGTQQFTNCPKTSLYNASQQKNPNLFQQVLLYNANGYIQGTGQTSLQNQSVIFTGLIESGSVLGFNGQDMDFQLLLAENGRNGNTATTTYYFYVELE